MTRKIRLSDNMLFPQQKKVQVDTIAASLIGLRPTRSCNACSIVFSGKVTRSRTSSGAVLWFMPKANNCMKNKINQCKAT